MGSLDFNLVKRKKTDLKEYKIEFHNVKQIWKTFIEPKL